ncbi:hypothetical protein AAVH_33692, partial [Aphelenchoides avenae]
MKLFTCCWRRPKDVSPALLSVPGEVLLDILLPLDRWTIDNVQFACRRFLRLISECMPDICLRQLSNASFYAWREYSCVHHFRANFLITVNGRSERNIQRAVSRRVNIARLFSQFVQALWSSYVDDLDFN